ncbi:MAG: CHAT domain-containing protein, partial [Bacteroidota bacterium]
GLLYSVPFHALCTNDTAGCSYLMDKYNLHQLSTTRYLADSTLINSKPLNNTIALYGGINYEIVNDTNNTNQEETNEDFLFANTLKRETTFKAVDYLPGTKQEVESVVPLLNENKWTTTLATGTKATEQLFKSKSDTLAPSIIHIATHGFAFPDKEEKRKKNNMDMLMLNNTQMQYTAAEDPMMRCGLMFAGANKSWTGKQKEMIEQTGQDGILTAAEVANMDLSNTKLVVLSACETGLGKVEGSEGVFGLQRGFKLAGVEQLIVSLWKVPDHETMELMNLFYSDLTITKDPVISFSKAQKQMRNNYPDNPEKWAGFVLVR